MNGTINFGSGRLFLGSGTNQQEVGVLQDVSVDFASESKPLKGGRKFPMAIAASGQSIKGKATSGLFSGSLIASILGLTATTGKRTVTSLTVAAGASVTVTPPNSGTFVADLGVEDANGVPMAFKAGGSPAVGQYSLTTDTVAPYIFNAAETGNVTISYQYSITTGHQAPINNDVQAAPTSYKLILEENYGGETFGLELFAVVIPSVSFGAKSEDFTSTDLTFEAVSTSTNTVGRIYFK